MPRNSANSSSDVNEFDCCSQLFGFVFSFFKPARQGYEPIPNIKPAVSDTPKAVNFSETVRKKLILSRSDLSDEGLTNDIWHSQTELNNYKLSAKEDLSKGLIQYINKKFIFYPEDNDEQQTNVSPNLIV